MSRYYIGIDTSNYTTSCALFDAESGEFLSNVKRLLCVEHGGRGLRQSDAVFAHVKNLPEVTAQALAGLSPESLCAVGVSVSPRDAEGSYMPCFLAGEAAASTLANGVKRPLMRFSHQAGHIMAAMWSSGSPDLLSREFIAFHVSGGTTEMLLVEPEIRAERDDHGLYGVRLGITKLGGTLDLNAGQAIDRAGVMMGLDFPCGAELEKMALDGIREGVRFERTGVSVKGCGCNLSGLENKVSAMLKSGADPRAAAMYTLDFVGRTLIRLTDNALEERAAEGRGRIPVLYAGGVMSCSIIKDMIKRRGYDARFAEPRFSSDNAAGTALLSALGTEGAGFWQS